MKIEAGVDDSGDGILDEDEVDSSSILCGTYLRATSCSEQLAQAPDSTDGLYTFDVNGTDLTVYCDMTRDGGGWTLVANNVDAVADNPTPNWVDALTAVTTVGTYGDDLSLFDVWVGLDYWNSLGTQIRMDFGNTVGEPAYQVIYDFEVDTAGNYSLDLGEGGPTIGDADTEMSADGWHAGAGFSTFDQDNDTLDDGNCSFETGANTPFWYKACWRETLWGYAKETGPFFNHEVRSWGAYWVK